MKAEHLRRVLLLIAASHPQATLAQSPIQRECEQVGMVAASAVRNRAHGGTKEELFRVLPSVDQPQDRWSMSEYRVLAAMHEIVDEVFDYPPLNEAAYVVYKTESCYQAASHTAEPKSFAQAHEELRICSALENDELIACSMRVAGATDG